MTPRRSKKGQKTKPINGLKKVRQKISQADIPGCSLNKAIRVARAIYENYGKDSAKPLWVAQAMEMSPNAGPFRMLTGASIAYGLTEGGYNASAIALTPLARRILAPTKDADDKQAKREATLKPRIISAFLEKYNDSPLPSDTIAKNVLEQEMGVPKDRTEQVLTLILESAKEVGFLREIKNKTYVDLLGVTPQLIVDSDDVEIDSGEEEVEEAESISTSSISAGLTSDINNKVFITHGKNHSFLEPIKKLLSFGGFEAVVAAEKQTVSQPVPGKVMESMRSCGAAIIHIDAEQKLIDVDAKEHVVLNPNVLIEIGAAMALYGKRFILLVRNGVQLPSNLQGLYEVRYEGETLDSDVTIKLLEAINDIKSHQLPSVE